MCCVTKRYKKVEVLTRILCLLGMHTTLFLLRRMKKVALRLANSRFGHAAHSSVVFMITHAPTGQISVPRSVFTRRPRKSFSYFVYRAAEDVWVTNNHFPHHCTYWIRPVQFHIGVKECMLYILGAVVVQSVLFVQ